jgi:HSP20 family molecular chaperone IbpA
VADVPGATPDGITITLERRTLRVHARVEDDAPAPCPAARARPPAPALR